MGKGSSSPPPAPDPAATSAAQSRANRETAVSQYGLNATNQVTPFGNLSYRQIGTWDDGTPRFEAVTAFSPEQQRLYETGTAASQRLADIGVNQLGQIGQRLGSPLQLGNEATEARLMDLGRRRLDPMFAERRAGLETQLANQGVSPGTEAYNRAMASLGQQQNDAYNQLLLSGRGQAANEALTARSAPINEISALLSGTQVSSPQFGNTPQVGVAPTDVTGPIMAQYQGQLAGWQQNQQSRNAGMGALFGLGGAALGGWARNGFTGLGSLASAGASLFSDERIKTDIKKVGQTDDGLPVYTYRYKNDPSGAVHMGVMAQDVEKETPEAVKKVGGIRAVDYSRVG